MKKILIIITIGICFTILDSCFSTEHYLIKEIEFYGVKLTNPEVSKDEDKLFIEVHDTIQDRLYFEVIGLGEYQYGYLKNVSFTNSCYATTVPTVSDNYLILDSLQLKFDSDIYFENDTIKANTDLWNHPKISDYRWSFSEDDLDDIYYRFNFGFDEKFYAKVEIPEKKYRIELTCKTSDNLTINESIDLYVKIGD